MATRMAGDLGLDTDALISEAERLVREHWDDEP
jgi:hypothetical protein